MYKNKFYACNGYNAVAVCDSWWQVERSRKYFKGFCNKRFDNFEDAERYALDICGEVFPRGRTMPEQLECNNIIFFKNCLKPLGYYIN